jgi:ribonuclease HI
MTICEKCRKKERLRKPKIHSTDVCEVCGKKTMCYDIDDDEVSYVPRVRMTKEGWTIVYTDASVDRNGRGIIALVSKELVMVKGVYDEVGSSEAEFMGVIFALQEYKGDKVMVITDHLPIADAFRSKARVDGKLKQYWDILLRLVNGREVKIKWVPRRENEAGKFLEMIKIRFGRRGGLFPKEFNLEYRDWSEEWSANAESK